MYRIRYLLIAATFTIISAVTAQKSFAEQKYWLDGRNVEAQEPTPGNATIDISTLSTGPHWLTIISKDEAGVWSSPVTTSFIVPYETADGKSIVEHQYWIDGKIEAKISQGEKPSAISIETLKPGVHTFSVRVKDNTGRFSPHTTKHFIVPPAVAGESIVEHQYWIDGKMEAKVTKGQMISAIDVSTLSPGVHTFTVRVKDNTGRFSPQTTKHFIVPFNEIAVAEKSIVEHQYWIDGKVEAKVTKGQMPSAIDVSTLSPGVHTFTVRVKDNTGRLSPHVTKYFIVPFEDADDKSIVEHQYWIDDNLEASVSQNDKPSIIDISTLKPGLHSLTVRVKDSTGKWSSQTARHFVLKEDGVVEDATITHGIYWFDDDLINATAVVLNSESGEVDIDIKDIEGGTHTLWWRCFDSNGALSDARSVSFLSQGYATFTVPSSGIGTFSSATNIMLPEGLNAYYCTDNEVVNECAAINLKKIDGKVINEGAAMNLKKIDDKVINANTGVILSGTPGKTYKIYPTEDVGAETPGNNLIAAVSGTDITTVDGEYTNFTLEEWQFAKVAENATMPDNSAYLHLPTGNVGDVSTIIVNDPEMMTQDDDGYYLIATARNWIEFSKIVETDKSANAKMIADVDLGDNQVHIGPQDRDAYTGIFDGQGHTLTVAYVGKSNEIVAPFTRVRGATIKNIHIAGSMKSIFAYMGVVGVVIGSNPSTISNVWNSATMDIKSDAWVQSGTILGGFKEQGIVVISDCLFTGTFSSDYGYYSGCFVGFDYDSGSITVNNCLSTGTFIMSGTSFHGNHTNCYVKSFPASYPSGVNVATNEGLSDGTIATALQADREVGTWIQDPNLGIPMLKVFSGDKYITYTVPASGMGTFSTNTPVQVPDGLLAYYCRSEMKDGTNGLAIYVRRVEGDVIDSNTGGVLLSGTPGVTYQLHYTSGAGATTVNNSLIPVIESTNVNGIDGEYYNFMLKDEDFVKIDGTALMPANSAYLHLPGSIVGDAGKIEINYDIVSGVVTPVVDYKPDSYDYIFNLNGQRMSEPSKGVNIINRRKVIVR
ncbi:MAG: hypothetical protein ACI30Y_03265 [Candidatus Limisoma sp.]